MMDNTHFLTGAPTTQISLFLKSIREREYSGAHQFKGGEIEAHFQKGLLHSTHGPAWRESTRTGFKLGWCLNGIVRAIEENDIKSVFDPRTGKFEPVREINFAQLGFGNYTPMASSVYANTTMHVLTPHRSAGRARFGIILTGSKYSK